MKSMKHQLSQMKKRNIVLIVLISLLVLILIYVIFNIVFWYKGAPECFFKYEITENNTVEIDYYSGPFFLLNIPDTIEGKSVTSIGSELFKDISFDNGKIVDSKYNIMQYYVTAVHLPDTVEEIHFFAFNNCKNLRSINIPVSLRYASSRILADTKVRELVFPEGITEIGCGYDYDLAREGCTESFADMKYLRKVVFPESLKKIGNNTFSGCTSLEKVTFPDSIEEMRYGAFQDSGLTEANIPKSLVKNSGCIFKETPFEEILEKEAAGDFIIFNDVLLYKYIGDDENVVIPDGIESICDRAFWTAHNVKTVEIPESVKYINDAFQYSSIESLVIPNTVDAENEMSFYYCSNLKEIVLPDCIKTIGSFAFCGCTSLERITIPESVEEIGDNAFSNCNSLKEAVITGSPHMGKDVFENCPALKNKSRY